MGSYSGKRAGERFSRVARARRYLARAHGCAHGMIATSDSD
jgi:hypothetical protein